VTCKLIIKITKQLHTMNTLSAELVSEFVNYGLDNECPTGCVTDMIRSRAYHFFEVRGRQPGHEIDDWIRAEREVKNHLGIVR
jgi:hypothetical protein